MVYQSLNRKISKLLKNNFHAFFISLKPNLMPKYEPDIDIGKIILQKLEEDGRSVAWLAKKINFDRGNLYRTLNNSRFVYYDLVYSISKAMKVDFFVPGTQKLKEES